MIPHDIIDRATARFLANTSVIETALGDGEYLVDDTFSVADIVVGLVLEFARSGRDHGTSRGCRPLRRPAGSTPGAPAGRRSHRISPDGRSLHLGEELFDRGEERLGLLDVRVWLDSSSSTHSRPGIASWICSTMRGVASSWRPETSSVGTSISCSRSVMSQSAGSRCSGTRSGRSSCGRRSGRRRSRESLTTSGHRTAGRGGGGRRPARPPRTRGRRSCPSPRAGAASPARRPAARARRRFASSTQSSMLAGESQTMMAQPRRDGRARAPSRACRPTTGRARGSARRSRGCA